MNEIINKILLSGDNSYLKFLVDHLLKIKKEFENLKKQEFKAYLSKPTT